MGLIDPIHLLLVGAVVLIVVGPRRLPELSRALGHAVHEFRAALAEGASADAPAHAGGQPEEHLTPGAPRHG